MIEKEIPTRFWKTIYGKFLEKMLLGGLGLISIWIVTKVSSLSDYNIEMKKDNERLNETVIELKNTINNLSDKVATKADINHFENSLAAQWRVLAELEKKGTDIEVRMRLLEMINNRAFPGESKKEVNYPKNCKEALKQLIVSLSSLKAQYKVGNVPSYVLDAEKSLNSLVERLGNMKEEHNIEELINKQIEENKFDIEDYRFRKEQQQIQQKL